MSGWVRKVRAGLVVALAFGVAWGTIVMFAMTLSMLIVVRLEMVAFLNTDWLLMYALWVAIGFVHGLVISLAMSIAGRNRTVDTFPRWLGGVLGAGVGGAGAIVVAALEYAGGPPLAIAWGMVGVTGAIGAVSTMALLTVARRGALPPPAVEPEQIGS
jgi:hypothetical protein